MRDAPAVRVACVAGPVWRAMQALLCCLAVAVIVGWPLRMCGVAPRTSLVVAMLAALAAGIGFARATEVPSPTLQWDGAGWSLLVPTGPQAVPLRAVDVMIDLGQWLLLRAHFEAGNVIWLTTSHADAPGDFVALCRALHARKPRPEPSMQAPGLPD